MWPFSHHKALKSLAADMPVWFHLSPLLCLPLLTEVDFFSHQVVATVFLRQSQLAHGFLMFVFSESQVMKLC
jgi:hypothetical protein